MYVHAKHLGGRRLDVVCKETGEIFDLAYEVDSDEGWINMFVRDGESQRVAHGKTVKLPSGREIFPLLIERQYRPFFIADAITGEVLAETK